MSAYLDHASTTPLHPVAAAAMLEALGTWADPSRLYTDARRARIALDAARATVAGSIGARPEEIVFTSGGTESCNLAVLGAARAGAAARKPARIIVGAIEHTAVLEAARGMTREGFEVVEVPVSAQGIVDLEALERVCAGGASLVSVQTANQEVGTLQPVAEAAAIARAAGAFIHTDACMTVGNVAADVRVLGIDLLSACGHKAYGPKGVGVLWARRGVRVRPTQVGDDRERNRRAGIENLPAIVGLAAALDARAGEMGEEGARLRVWTEHLRAALAERVEDLMVLGHSDQRLPSLIAFSAGSVDGEALLLGFDRRGFAVHSGSSCTSSTTEPSHVLAAMGAPTHGSIRVSLGRGTIEAEVEAFIDAVPDVVSEARRVTAR